MIKNNMKKFFKNVLKKLTSRTLTLKFYYSSLETASRVFNILSNFFTLNKDKFQILKSKMTDDYWDTEQYIVFFKIRELEEDPELNNLLRKLMSGSTSFEMSEYHKTKKGFNQ